MCVSVQSVEQTATLPDIWDTMTLMWQHCNALKVFRNDMTDWASTVYNSLGNKVFELAR